MSAKLHLLRIRNIPFRFIRICNNSKGGIKLFELVELLSQVNAQIFKILSPLVKENHITITELIILWKINKNGTYRITDLAREVGVPSSTLTGVFDRLESKDYLVRIHDRKDRRSVLIQGTPQLKEMIDSVIRSADKELINLLDTLPPGFINRFLQNLKDLQIHLSQKVTETKND
jgi:DNA-binding MarR family transcriptional regulator